MLIHVTSIGTNLQQKYAYEKPWPSSKSPFQPADLTAGTGLGL
jgi:hypothetical protein